MTDKKIMHLETIAPQPRKIVEVPVVNGFIDETEREAFLIKCNEGFAALRADPIAWAEELEELEFWDTTLEDGLSDE